MRPRKVLRIARWEVGKRARANWRVTVAAVLLVLATAGLAAAAAPTAAFDRGLYRVGVAPNHPYHDVAQEDPTFAVRAPAPAAFEAGRLEILVKGSRASYRDTEKGRAAVEEFRRAIERYNDRRMAEEDNATAAYPVIVTLRYVEREGPREGAIPSRSADGTADRGTGDGDEGDGGDSTPTAATTDGDDGGARLGAPAIGGILRMSDATGSPSDISPPFPFQSLVLAFLFVLPLNFVVQTYGSSMLSERVNRRGELMLVAPVSRHEIIAGKTLPYLLASLAMATLIAFAIGGGPLSVLAVVPLALLFLGATFVGAMFARSFKELTFVTVAISVFLTTYAFVPAIFTDLAPVALISPLTLAVRDLTGGGVGLAAAAFSLLPASLTALVLFALGSGVYREEDLFTQRSIHLKALDALAAQIRGTRSLALVTILLLPFVFVIELLALALLFALPYALAVSLLLGVVAAVEELAKSLPTYAGFVHSRYPRTAATAVAAGLAAGGGFFIAEKFALVARFVGLGEVPASVAVVPAGAGGPAGLLLLVAPLVLHVTTASLSALGARRGVRGYAVGLGAAVAVHLAYNLAVVVVLG